MAGMADSVDGDDCLSVGWWCQTSKVDDLGDYSRPVLSASLFDCLLACVEIKSRRRGSADR